MATLMPGCTVASAAAPCTKFLPKAAATGFTAALSFRVAADKRVLWIRQDFAAIECGALGAIGLLELGLDPARLLLLRLADVADVLRAASDALSCAALGAV